MACVYAQAVAVALDAFATTWRKAVRQFAEPAVPFSHAGSIACVKGQHVRGGGSLFAPVQPSRGASGQ